MTKRKNLITLFIILAFIGCGENSNSIDSSNKNDVMVDFMKSKYELDDSNKEINITKIMKITSLGYTDKKNINDTLTQIKSKGQRMVNTLLSSNSAVYGQYQSPYYKYIYKLKADRQDRMGVFIIKEIYNRNYPIIQKLNIKKGFVILIDGHANPKVLFAGNLSAPRAYAGADKTVNVDEAVTLYGSGTDSDGSIISYEWKKGSQVLGASSRLVYTPTVVGKDTLTLTVMDNDGLTATDSINLTVKSTCDALSQLLGTCTN